MSRLGLLVRPMWGIDGLRLFAPVERFEGSTLLWAPRGLPLGELQTFPSRCGGDLRRAVLARPAQRQGGHHGSSPGECRRTLGPSTQEKMNPTAPSRAQGTPPELYAKSRPAASLGPFPPLTMRDCQPAPLLGKVFGLYADR